MKSIRLYSGLFLFLLLSELNAQINGGNKNDTIRLINPSFEDVPKQSAPPIGWTDCGFSGETPPDVHPSGFWEVSKPANHGRTYLGLVVRNNDTWERMSQMLESPIQAGQCYTFSIHLSSSDNYKSRTNVNRDSIFNFNIPAVLRIWAGNISCGRSELLGESPPIDNYEWKKFDFRFKPKNNYNYIMLEAFFKTPTLMPYNGNVLADNASVLIKIPCDQKTPPPPPVVAAVPPKPKINTPLTKETIPAPVASGPNWVKPKVGEIIRINNVYFKADSAAMTPESYFSLDNIYTYLRDNQFVKVEIGGHTNGLPKDDFCDSLSTLRAKAVAEYLINKGIPKERMTYYGYGRRKPVDSNATREGRARNQRVELKILSVG